MQRSTPRTTEDYQPLQDSLYETVIRRVVHSEDLGFCHVITARLFLPHDLNKFVAEISPPHCIGHQAHQQQAFFSGVTQALQEFPEDCPVNGQVGRVEIAIRYVELHANTDYLPDSDLYLIDPLLQVPGSELVDV